MGNPDAVALWLTHYVLDTGRRACWAQVRIFAVTIFSVFGLRGKTEGGKQKAEIGEDRVNAERGMVLRLSSDFLAAPDLPNAVGRGPSRPSLTGLVGFESGTPRLKSWAIVGRPSGTKAKTKAKSRK